MAAPPNVARALQRILELEVLPPSETVRPPGPTALLNPRRLEVVLTAAAYPGIHIRSAARLLVSSLDAVRGHVARLEADRVVRTRRQGRRVCLFVSGQYRPGEETLLALWADPVDRRTLEALRRRDPSTRPELLAATGLGSGALDRSLGRLRAAEAIWTTLEARLVTVRRTPVWRRFEFACRTRGQARLERFRALLAAQALRPAVEAVEANRARLSVDGPRARIRFVLPLDPLA